MVVVVHAAVRVHSAVCSGLQMMAELPYADAGPRCVEVCSGWSLLTGSLCSQKSGLVSAGDMSCLLQKVFKRDD